MIIAIASDHGGFALKNTVREHLKERGVKVVDLEMCIRDRDRNDGDILAFEHVHLCPLHRRFNFNFFQRKISGRFKAHEHGDLSRQFAKILYAGLRLSHQRDLVLNQRMIKYIYLSHRMRCV